MTLFIGGQRGNQSIDVAKIGNRYPRVLYIQCKLTFEEYQTLAIDDRTMWKVPEEVYYYDVKTRRYVFDRIIKYKVDL